MEIKQIFEALGLQEKNSGACFGPDGWLEGSSAPVCTSYNPTTGEAIGQVQLADDTQYEKVTDAACKSFETWRTMPAPARGEIIRELGEELRRLKEPLGYLVSLEMGKILQEGLGEVQEMIDICDFAVGLSRQLYGLSMHSERPGHRMYEQWHPLGPIGIVTAFNFPVAVWAWNAAIAAVCGDTMVWKPSPKTPLTAVAIQHMTNRLMEKHELSGVFTLLVGDVQPVGERLIADTRFPLISATGSTRMGRRVAEVVGKRLGRTLLELGGNNAIIVDETADLDLAVRAILFAAVGTAGQRCTTLRRLIAHSSVVDELLQRLSSAYEQVRIGDPLSSDTLMGPLIDQDAVDGYLAAIEEVKKGGGEIVCGGEALERDGFFVTPCIAKVSEQLPIVKHETFAPILYVLTYETLEEAIALQNDVPQGLSSAIFTSNLFASERFLAATGSDCGIANVNIGTSGAEIGGAFGGEKETGGGREAGSDSWRTYMRRQTTTINWSGKLPLAQGIKFG